ncbi:glycosyltransferase [Alkalihalobacterium elongatum]|uniref:glycosyltransferase n=1 Tax=Alkalihalobacterium elongatum TaxID=2675466 RepID=UPI001C1FF7F7|nr:glycosyltransferase family A protein [Alkalihalobacterium elongatum]
MVTVITCTTRQEFMNNVFENYERQVWNSKELIIILNNDDMDIHTWKKQARQFKDVSVFQLPSSYSLGECLNFGIEKAKYDTIAKFDDDDYYAAFYTFQAMEAFNNTDASIVGKHSTFMYFEESNTLAIFFPNNENRFTGFIKGGTIVFKKEIYNKVKFIKAEVSTDSYFLQECQKKGYKFYATDRYNYVCVRRVDKNTHTQKRSDKSYLRDSLVVCKTRDFRPYVTKS